MHPAKWAALIALASCNMLAPANAAGFLDKMGDALRSGAQGALRQAAPDSADAVAKGAGADGAADANVAQLPGAELVISSVRPKSLADARAHRISSARDGDPVYLYLKLPRPVESYVFTWNLTGTSEYANRKAIGIQIVPPDQPDELAAVIYNNFLPTDAELKASEIVIEMAPGELRPLSVDGWLRLVGGGRAGTWPQEFRIYTRDMNAFTTTILARAPLTANVEGGVTKYKAQLDAFKARQAAGDPSFNTIPTRGAIVDVAAEKKAAESATKASGTRFDKFFLTGDVWWENRTALGQLEKHYTSALGLYKTSGKCMAAIVNVNRWANQSITSEITKTFEISCDKLAAAR
ncbi:hypothetical protein Q9Q94_04225 [Uliginosibacterium sp. 31-16]|uniref:hypothetical protein n=1 Tax=Uliginosibacterium sp. 31-16 TaxID=3068315 RepID=UPI00273DDCA0|nr:hypothetical protein [Uliginosibacterium sp. 31-16]MDP5238720.1 hypothetical protein [Uliginosibacterium sp. 31-16]